MPNIRISNTIPNMKLRSDISHVRISSFQTGRVSETPSIGTPIGLLLALTYSFLGAFAPHGDARPNVRISN